MRAGGDFWPGEYSKTWIHLAERSPAGLVEGMKAGNLFAVHGDLIEGLRFSAERRPGRRDDGNERRAAMGGTLTVARGDDVVLTIKLRSPARNAHGDAPAVDHVDVIAGALTGVVADRASDSNPTTAVLRRIPARELQRDEDGWYEARVKLKDVTKGFYVRLRGTNLGVAVPGPTDAAGNPIVDAIAATPAAAVAEAWRDLWFYSSPIFVEVK